MSDIQDLALESDEDSLFPVVELTFEPGQIAFVVTVEGDEQDAETAEALQTLLNDSIYDGPSKLTAQDVIDSGSYDIIYADTVSILQDTGYEDVIDDFYIMNCVVVNDMIIVNAGISSLDLDADDLEEIIEGDDDESADESGEQSKWD